ncbi:7949_t:CDS:2 [Funneliformis geosporum]|nr:7949_t:CDS:2 [Funneliformis geosporum]
MTIPGKSQQMESTLPLWKREMKDSGGFTVCFEPIDAKIDQKGYHKTFGENFYPCDDPWTVYITTR